MYSLVLRGPLGVPDIVFPQDKNGWCFSKKHVYRKLHNRQNITSRWMTYSQAKNRVYCFCCKLYDRNPLSPLAQDGCCDLIHVGDVLKTHEKSKNHFDAYCLWLQTKLRLTKDNGIDQINQQFLKKKLSIGGMFSNVCLQ